MGSSASRAHFLTSYNLGHEKAKEYPGVFPLVFISFSVAILAVAYVPYKLQHNRINYSHFVVSLIQVACSTASFANLTISVRNWFLSLCMMSLPSFSNSDLSTTANSHLLIDPQVCNQGLSEHRTQQGIYA